MEIQFDLNTLWFLLVGVLLTGYAILDGFDLGVGALHLLSKTDQDRRIFLNAIGPVWDGNEVWLVTGGGALFAAFPHVYASVFSGFYTAFMLLLVVLIFRAVAIEFRSKQPSPRWRKTWDVAFSVASIFIALLAGVALGNVMWGVPFDARGEIDISLLGLLNPYALLVGVSTVLLFTMHGSIYLVMKTEGELQEQVKGWVRRAIIAFVISYGILTMATLIYVPEVSHRFREVPALFGLALLTGLAVANVPREITKGREMRAFISSSAVVAGLMALIGVSVFPNLVPAVDPANSLTIYNSASSARTLQIMAIIAAIGMPFVLTYSISIYWVFRGKVRLDESSY